MPNKTEAILWYMRLLDWLCLYSLSYNSNLKKLSNMDRSRSTTILRIMLLLWFGKWKSTSALCCFTDYFQVSSEYFWLASARFLLFQTLDYSIVWEKMRRVSWLARCWFNIKVCGFYYGIIDFWMLSVAAGFL